MTNREWLQGLPDVEIAMLLSTYNSTSGNFEFILDRTIRSKDYDKCLRKIIEWLGEETKTEG